MPGRIFTFGPKPYKSYPYGAFGLRGLELLGNTGRRTSEPNSNPYTARVRGSSAAFTRTIRV